MTDETPPFLTAINDQTSKLFEETDDNTMLRVLGFLVDQLNVDAMNFTLAYLTLVNEHHPDLNDEADTAVDRFIMKMGAADAIVRHLISAALRRAHGDDGYLEAIVASVGYGVEMDKFLRALMSIMTQLRDAASAVAEAEFNGDG